MTHLEIFYELDMLGAVRLRNSDFDSVAAL